MKNTIALGVCDVVSITAGKQPVTVWNLVNDGQPVHLQTVNATESIVLGPYLNAVNIGLSWEDNGSVVVESLTKSFATPVNFPVPQPGVAVDDATGAEDIVDQFNALLTSLRNAGFIAESEE